MKALSLWQPWASFMFAGVSHYPPKSIETRGTRIIGRYRGEVAIHAMAKEPSDVLLELLATTSLSLLFRRYFASVPVDGGCDSYEDRIVRAFEELPRGCVLGKVDVVECVATDNVDRKRIGPDEEALGNYQSGRFAIATRSAVRLYHPLAWKGKQGLWTLPDEEWANAAAGGTFALRGLPRWIRGDA